MKPNPNQIALKKGQPYSVKGTAGNLAVKDVDFSSRIVTGMFNTAYWFDTDMDIILPGANTKSINERGPLSSATQKIKHLSNHQWLIEKMPGKIVTLEEKEVEINGMKVHGTYFETRMSETEIGRDTLIKYHEGIYDQHSEGFQYVEGEYIDADMKDEWSKYKALVLNPEDMEKAGYAFLWKQLRMFEGSTVPFGANSLTPCLGLKSVTPEALSLKLMDRIDALERQLRNGTLTDASMQECQMQCAQLKQLIKEFADVQPDVKGTLVKGRQNNDTVTDSIDFKTLILH
jgi:hypothetical protein